MGYPQAAIVALALGIALIPGRATAQADTAYAREVYGEVQKNLAQMQRLQFNASQPGIPVPAKVTAWSEGKDVRKIQVLAPDDSGDVVVEYYYGKGGLVFVYMAIKGETAAGKQRTGEEHRQYFRDGRMLRWLGGMEKKEIPASNPDFATEARDRLAYSAAYLEGVQMARETCTQGKACNVTLRKVAE